MGRFYIGISGWRYERWRGVFYPKGLRQADELEYASRRFNSIEINGSFYSLQRPESYACWRDATPGDFTFAVKGNKYLTHYRMAAVTMKALRLLREKRDRRQRPTDVP